MTRWRRRFIEGDLREPSDRTGSGLWCSGCLEELDKNELYGVGENGEVLCASCAGDLWDGLSDEDRLRVLGYEVKG